MAASSPVARSALQTGLASLLGGIIALAAFSVVAPAQVNAHSCITLHPRERLDRGDAAVIARFLGPSTPDKVSDPRTTADLFKTRWAVDEWLTGDGPDEIVVSSSVSKVPETASPWASSPHASRMTDLRVAHAPGHTTRRPSALPQARCR